MSGATCRISSGNRSKAIPSPTLFVQRKCSCGGVSKLGGQCDECEREKLLGVQAKLRIGPENDAYEQEADRVAERIISMPDIQTGPKLVRSTHTIQSKTMNQRNPGGDSPAVTNLGIHSSGKAMDSATRAFMEQRFGHDFSKVSIHENAEAQRSAQSINARAYTLGNNIVFGQGQYSTGTTDGKRLLAHELTHVVQQQSMPTTIQRETETDVTVHAPEGPPGCTLEQHSAIFPAVLTAEQWLQTAVSGLDTYIGNPSDADSATTRNALNRHFNTTDTSTASTLRDRLDLIRRDLRQRGNSANPDPRRRHVFTVECHDETDSLCEVSNAYVRNYHMLVFCPIFFDRFSPTRRASSVIHEMAHALVGLRITDRAYSSDRLLQFLSTPEALDNAESYSMYAQEVGTGIMPENNAPVDEIDEDCPDQTAQLARVALARGQRWNRRANWTMRGTSYSAMITRHLGDATPTTRTEAAAKYKKMADRFRSPLNVRCSDENCGGRDVYKQEQVNRRGAGAGIGAGIGLVGGAIAGGFLAGAAGAVLGGLIGGAIGGLIGLGFGALASSDATINLCPTWAGQAIEGDRVESLLGVAYELYADCSAADSVKYAALAREIYETHFSSRP